MPNAQSNFDAACMQFRMSVHVGVCVCVFAVEPEVQELARSAVRALRGVRLCAEGHEEGRLTHLVLGQQRRTLKVPYPSC